MIQIFIGAYIVYEIAIGILRKTANRPLMWRGIVEQKTNMQYAKRTTFSVIASSLSLWEKAVLQELLLGPLTLRKIRLRDLSI